MSRLFARLALDYADHPKIATLSDAAFRCHVELILYARKYETDGIIKKRVANRVGSRWDTDVLTELRTNDDDAPSLILLDNGDYEIHGYADMQETKAEISARRRKNAENGRLGGRPAKPNKTQSVTHSDTQSLTQSGTQKKAETETETETDKRLSSEVADAPVRPDVIELLDYLDSQIEAYDPEAKIPSRTKSNKDAARLLLDKDGRTVTQVKAAIKFSQDDEFWRPNIRSMSKLRDKYDQLRAKAASSNGRPTQAAARRTSWMDNT